MTTATKKVTRVIRLLVTTDEEWLTHDGDDTSEQGISDSWEELENSIKSVLNKEFYWDTTEISIIEWEDDECPECNGNNINGDIPECRDCEGGPNA